MQHAVDAEADLQPAFLRFDMDVGRAYLGGVLEYRLQQLDDGCFFQPRIDGQRAEIDGDIAQVLFQLACQGGNIFRAAVDAVDRLQHFRFIDDGQLDMAFDQPSDLVVGEQVSRIGHADQQAFAAVFQYQRAETAGLGFRQQTHQLGIDVEKFQVDVGNVQLARQGARNLLFGHIAMLDKHPAQLAARTLLFRQRQAQLFFRQQFLLHQNFTETDFLRPCHAYSSTGSMDISASDAQRYFIPERVVS